MGGPYRGRGARHFRRETERQQREGGSGNSEESMPPAQVIELSPRQGGQRFERRDQNFQGQNAQRTFNPSGSNSESRMHFFLQLVNLAFRFSSYYAPVFEPWEEFEPDSGINRNHKTVTSIEAARMCHKGEQKLQAAINDYPRVEHIAIIDMAETWFEAGRSFFQAARTIIVSRQEELQGASTA